MESITLSLIYDLTLLFKHCFFIDKYKCDCIIYGFERVLGDTIIYSSCEPREVCLFDKKEMLKRIQEGIEVLKNEFGKCPDQDLADIIHKLKIFAPGLDELI